MANADKRRWLGGRR